MFGNGKGKGNAERPAGNARLTPVDVQQVQFRLAFRGYNERDVDAFLDRVTEDLTARTDERDRLIRQLEAGGGGSPDVAGARAEADAIVARAREEAQEILRRAMAEATAARGGTGPVASTGDARAALAPFLAKEKEFLAKIGSVVQGHAEDIRAMLQELRSAGGGEPRA